MLSSPPTQRSFIAFKSHKKKLTFVFINNFQGVRNKNWYISFISNMVYPVGFLWFSDFEMPQIELSRNWIDEQLLVGLCNCLSCMMCWYHCCVDRGQHVICFEPVPDDSVYFWKPLNCLWSENDIKHLWQWQSAVVVYFVVSYLRRSGTNVSLHTALFLRYVWGVYKRGLIHETKSLITKLFSETDFLVDYR